MSQRAYCPACNKAVEFSTVRRMKVTEYEGRRYRYLLRVAVCAHCGNDATFQPYQEEAGIAFNECLRKGAGLVSLEDILEVPKRYDIGKRPLSRVLGLGEHTYTQLMEGQAPSPKHSELIRLVLEDPCYYRSLLESHRDSISASAYKRSLSATKTYMSRTNRDDYRIYEIGRTFVQLAHGDITAMAIQKLTYYYQGFSKTILGSRAFRQMPRAWAAGPVYGRLWHEYRDDPRGYFSYEKNEEHSSPFTPAEDELIYTIYRSFGCYSGSTLSSMTHSEAPWIEARRRAGAQAGERCAEAIAERDLDSYFEQVAHAYNIEEASDIERYAQDLFHRVVSSKSQSTRA